MRRWLRAIARGLGQEEILSRSEFGGTMINPKRPFPTKVFQDFSKQELQSFLETLHYSLEADTPEDVTEVLCHLRRLVPFKYIIAGLVRLGSSTGAQEFSNVINISYPAEWLDHYVKNQYATVDPILSSHLKHFSTQIWAEAYKEANSRREREFIEHAKSYGLVDGVTTGSIDPRRGFGSFFSFAGEPTRESARYGEVLEYIVHHLHQALVKHAISPSHNRAARLTAREISVLNWIKMGKTNWEISRILGVTERTVRFHVESIFNKLDVTSRTQAVALAVENGLLTFV